MATLVGVFSLETFFYEAMGRRSNIRNLPIDWINPNIDESSIDPRKTT